MEQLATWRDVAVVVLAVQCLVGVVLTLALTYVLVRLMNTAQGKVEAGAKVVQKYTRRMVVEADKASVRVAEPVLKMRARATRVGAVVQRFVPGFTLPAAPPEPPAAGRGTIQQ